MRQLDLLKKLEKLNADLACAEMNRDEMRASIAKTKKWMGTGGPEAEAADALSLQICEQRMAYFDGQMFMQEVAIAKTRHDLNRVIKEEKHKKYESEEQNTG